MPVIQDFRTVPAGYYFTPHWQAFRLRLFKAWNWKCAVCGWDWRERGGRLEGHHFPEGYRNLFREKLRHCCPLCDLHHKKGQIPPSEVRSMRQAYQTRKWVARLCRACWRATVWILRVSWRLARRLFRWIRQKASSRAASARS